MERALAVLRIELDTSDIDRVSSHNGELFVTDMLVGKFAGWAEVQAAWWAEINAMKSLVAEVNEETCVAEVQDEVVRARNVVERAMQRSTDSFTLPVTFRVTGSAVVASSPLLVYVVVTAAGTAFEPAGVAMGIAIAALGSTTAIAAWRALRPGVSTGIVACLGAAASLAVFASAYLACRAVEVTSITTDGATSAPIGTISEACMVALTVGVTGGTIGIDLNGSARAVAFVQILLTVSGVVALLSAAWQRLVARTSEGRGDTDAQ